MSFSFGVAVRALLLGDADLNLQLPGGIHPDSIPQESTFPAMAYSVASEPFTSITGQSSIRFATMEIKVVAAGSSRRAAEQSAAKLALVEAEAANPAPVRKRSARPRQTAQLTLPVAVAEELK